MVEGVAWVVVVGGVDLGVGQVVVMVSRLLLVVKGSSLTLQPPHNRAPLRYPVFPIHGQLNTEL